MSLEIFTKLENQIERLVEKVNSFQKEKENLVQEIAEKKSRIENLEQENNQLKEDLSKVSGNVDDRERQINLATDKIQGLLSKLESIA